MGKYLLGLDEGTTGCKAVIFDFEGTVMGSDYREYPCYYPNPGWVEQTAEDITPALYATVKATIADAGVDPKAIVGHGHFIPGLGQWLLGYRMPTICGPLSVGKTSGEPNISKR